MAQILENVGEGVERPGGRPQKKGPDRAAKKAVDAVRADTFLRQLFASYEKELTDGGRRLKRARKVDAVVIEQLKIKLLGLLEDWNKETTHLDNDYWEHGDFTTWPWADTLEETIWFGKFSHALLQASPPLFATFYTEKYRDNKPDAPTRRVAHILVADRPITRADMIVDHDAMVALEQIAFGVCFDRGGPGRHSLQHRFLAPKYRDQGLGSAVLAKYEQLFQAMADVPGEKPPISNVLKTCQLDTMCWAIKNGYKPNTPEDQKKWQEVCAKKTAAGEEIFMNEERTIVVPTDEGEEVICPLYIKFGKIFIPTTEVRY